MPVTMTAGYKAPSEEGSLMSRGEPLPVLSCSHGNINGSGDSAGPKFSSLDFKSGASYEGGLDNGKKCGTGRFTWPNGAWFEGEYVNDIRQGKGRTYSICNYNICVLIYVLCVDESYRKH